MSKTVDERVLEMRFDNSQFESNVKLNIRQLMPVLSLPKISTTHIAISKVLTGSHQA